MRLALAAAGGFCFWLLLDGPAHAAESAPDPASIVDTVVDKSVRTVAQAVDGRPAVAAPPARPAPVRLPPGQHDEVVGELDDAVRAPETPSHIPESSNVRPAAPDSSRGAAPGRYEVSREWTGEPGCQSVSTAEPAATVTLRLLAAGGDSYPPAPQRGPCAPPAAVMSAPASPSQYDVKGVLSGGPAGAAVAASPPAGTVLDRLQYGPTEPPVSPD